MKILALEQEYQGKTSHHFKPFLLSEAEAVWGLYKQDIIREIYFRADQSTAVLLLECKDVTEAEEIISQLPMVKEGLIYFKIIPLTPYPGFERLFRH